MSCSVGLIDQRELTPRTLGSPTPESQQQPNRAVNGSRR
jgi:hypothetical protein